MQLSKNFALSEMIVSRSASRAGIRNEPGPEPVAALTRLCQHVLQPLRDHYGKAIVVSSGYRSPRLNAAVGGASSSQHVKGEAADFTIPGESNLAVCQWMQANLEYDQLIYEFGEGGWIHVSYSASRLRNEELSAKRRGGKTVYLPGLVA